jgi:prepilin-type N-terminal cleavage/methylation domain-containing protein
LGRRFEGQAGFTLIEMVAVVAVTLGLAAIAGPRIDGYLRIQRATNSARMVERQLQTARLKAVTVSRGLRVQFDCPSAGKLRILELTGVAATDNATNRCDPTAFPSPGPSDTLRATPSLDSPVIELPSGTTVTGAPFQIEFSPQGSAYAVATSGTVTPLPDTTVLTVTRTSISRTIAINGLGRIRLN